MPINTTFLKCRSFYNPSNRERRNKRAKNPSILLIFCFMKESNFQNELIQELKKEFPGCLVLKNDANYIQGIPDLLILYKTHWAALECKVCESAHHQPNQDYYISIMNGMSYAKFIYPENKEEILNELQQTFRVRRISCLPISKQVSLDKL